MRKGEGVRVPSCLPSPSFLVGGLASSALEEPASGFWASAFFSAGAAAGASAFLSPAGNAMRFMAAMENCDGVAAAAVAAPFEESRVMMLVAKLAKTLLPYRVMMVWRRAVW